MTNVEANTNQKIAAVAEQGANLTPQAAPSKKMDRHHKGASKTKKPIKATAPEKQTKAKRKTAKATRKAAAPRNQRKSAKILELIGRAKGATLSEIMKLTGWQAPSVRGFISTAGNKYNLQIESSKNDSGDRLYCVTR